jgi:hypothetical protein
MTGSTKTGVLRLLPRGGLLPGVQSPEENKKEAFLVERACLRVELDGEYFLSISCERGQENPDIVIRKKARGGRTKKVSAEVLLSDIRDKVRKLLEISEAVQQIAHS